MLLGVTAGQGISSPRLDTLDPGLPINASGTGHITGVRSVFDTNYWFFLGAGKSKLSDDVTAVAIHEHSCGDGPRHMLTIFTHAILQL